MKVETPQILWNTEGDKGLNAALYSIDMLESGLTSGDEEFKRFGNVLATAGNTNIINLWRVCFKKEQGNNKKQVGKSSEKDDNNNNTNNNSGRMFQSFSKSQTKNGNCMNSQCKIEYICSLTRHEQGVNTVAFSPDGLHLATAGDTGSIIIWSVPLSKRGNNNGKHFWSTISDEKELSVKIVTGGCINGGGVCDISWSKDSKRFMAGTIDHSVFVVEDETAVSTAISTSSSATGGQQGELNQSHQSPTPPKENKWKVIYRNGMDHTSYVQGVSYDPSGVYLASMSSDRSVRVFTRKTPPKSKKKVLRSTTNRQNEYSTSNNNIPPQDHQMMVDQILTDSKFELGKSKQIKYRRITITTNSDKSDSNNTTTENTVDNETAISSEEQQKTTTTQTQTTQVVKRNLYADESTLESFFRRLSWTTDGAFLVTPAALWHHHPSSQNNVNNAATSLITAAAATTPSPQPTYATYLFARHKFDEPYRVLSGLEKPSVVVRPNPKLFKLPNSVITESKENQSPSSSSRGGGTVNARTSAGGLPYRSIFALLTLDSVLLYDTYHIRPLCIIRGLHYANYTDCTWSTDGLSLVLCSTDGYISLISFDQSELGEIYEMPSTTSTAAATTTMDTTTSRNNNTTPTISPNNNKAEQGSQLVIVKQPTVTIPPCEPGQSATIEAPPSKRAKKTRITPTLISTTTASTNDSKVLQPTNNNSNGNENNNHTKRPASTVEEDGNTTKSDLKPAAAVATTTCTVEVGEAVTKLTLNNNTSSSEKPKKKKRVTPMLISAST